MRSGRACRAACGHGTRIGLGLRTRGEQRARRRLAGAHGQPQWRLGRADLDGFDPVARIMRLLAPVLLPIGLLTLLTIMAAVAAPALKTGFMPLDRSGEVFSWDPV